MNLERGRWFGVVLVLVAALVTCLAASAKAQVASGYSEYYIPGGEDEMSLALRTFGNQPAVLNMQALIAITAWSDNITVYYDHWEDGVEFDPENPETTYDEKFTLATTGTLLSLDNTPAGGIVIPRNAANTYYDGGDRMYVVGGAVTVTRVSWRFNLSGVGRAVQAVAWEIYPVKPQLTTYVLPFGQNLSGAPKNYTDFLKCYAIVQATANGTSFTVDLDGNGTADPLDQNFDGDTADAGDTTTVTLQAGQSFFIGDVTLAQANASGTLPRGARATINSNAVIEGSSTLQVKFIIGDPAATFETRGLSAFPRGYWTKEYYAPVWEPAATVTDIFMYNPDTSPITITYETQSTTGSFTINARDTISYRGAVAGGLPLTGGVYLRGSGPFWGVSTIDSTGGTNEWAYSLLPSTLLYEEHFLGWAPGGADGNDSGAFLTPVQDNTSVFVDVNNDGTADQSYTLNRLQTQYIVDLTDNDLSGAHFWATGPFTMSYGQNPDTAPAQATSGDLGYVAIPGTDFISLVLTVDKSVSPQVVPTAIGSTASFTLAAASQKYDVDGVTLVDTLPPDWAYVDGSATVTMPDRTTVTGVNPTITGSGTVAAPYVLSWSSAQLGTDGTPGMAENQEVSVTFTAVTTAVIGDGALSRNHVRATGTRTVGGVTQTFNATDFAYVASGSLGIKKTSVAPDPAYPGDQIDYTVTVTNPPGGATQTGVSLYDAIPAGLSYVGASGQVACDLAGNYNDQFGAASYANSNGTRDWSASPWTETDNQAGGAATGLALVTGGVLRLGLAENYQDQFGTAGSFAGTNGSTSWAASPWVETESVTPASAATGLIQVVGGVLRIGQSENVRDQFGAAAYTNNNGSANWASNWTETDAYGTGPAGAGAGAAGGYVWVTGGQLQFRYLLSTVADTFATAGSFASNDGSTNWATNWAETNDDADGNNGDIEIETNRLEFQDTTDGGNDATAEAIGRTATVTGATTVRVTYTWDNGTVDPGEGEGILVQWSLTGGAGTWSTLRTLDGDTADATFTDTIAWTPANTTFYLRFRAYGNYDNNDESYINDVGVAFDVPANATNTAIQRTANLAGATGAVLNFTAAAGALEAGDTLQVQCGPTAAGAWTTLATYTGATPDVAPPYTLPAACLTTPATATIRFLVTGGYNDADGSDTLSFDNVDVTYQRTPSSILRTANLGGAASAQLSFATTPANLEAADTLRVECGPTATGPWTKLADFAGGTPDAAQPYALPAACLATPATATVRFRVTGGYDQTDETMSFDNVDLVYVRAPFTSVQRPANLANAASATLSFTYTAANLEAGDTFVVEASSDGVTWGAPLETIDGAAGTVTKSYNLKAPTDYTAAGTVIRLRITSGFDQTNETISFDNVDIATVTPSTFASGNPPAFLRSSTGCQIPAGGTVVLTFSVTVDTPLPSGITSATNTAAVTTATYPIQLTASVTDNLANPSVLSASAAGRVWLDDGDGVLETGEPGIPNVEVTLKDEFGTPVAVTLTDAFGYWIFTGVTPGDDYWAEATDGLLADTSQVYPAQPGPPAPDSNRTVTFDLAAGEERTGLNLGYAPDAGTASFGDLAWVDADGDGVRDAGEVGLGGVSVTIWQDVATTDGAPDGILDAECTPPVTVPDDCDTLLDTTTTAPDGSYLFTGIPATGAETYFVAGAGPVGYDSTTNGTHRFFGASPGTYLSADFGFQADGATLVTYEIRDRVWLDGNGDGVFDGGEGGIAGVTIELLDASRNVIGTTTTAADGTFAFTGVTGGGADYTLRVNDTTGALVDTFGTTASALARERAIENLTASVDRRFDVADPDLDPSFGFGVARSIGDTVFNDSSGGAGDNVQQAGELGIAGVDVSLYRDVNADGLLDGGDTLVGTVSTDANGKYLFSGLANGGYIVSVAGPAGYGYSGSDTDPAAGVQRTATIAGGGSDLTADFGFRAPVQRTVSGTLWEDADADGVLDAGELVRLAGVTVDVYEGPNFIITVTTDANGYYEVPGLRDATVYSVTVTDTGSVLTGYTATIPATASRTADTTGGDVANVNFGFNKPAPTRVFLAWLRAVPAPQGVVVEWETTTEIGTVGYRLARLEGGVEVPVNERVVPAFVESRSGGRYALADPGAAGSPLAYTLYEVRRGGAPVPYGPFTVVPQRPAVAAKAALAGAVGASAPLAIPDGRSYARTLRRPPAARVAAAAPALPPPPAAAVGQKIRIGVTADGLYRLFASDVAAMLGRKPAKVATMIAEGSLLLSNRGAAVAYLPRDGGASLLFRGEALDTNFTGENVYWLEAGAGRRMKKAAVTAANASAKAKHFPAASRAEGHGWPDFLAGDDPNGDYWRWKFLFAGDPDFGSVAVPIEAPAPAAAGLEATLTVRLHGGNDTAANPDHHVVIRLNGTPVGEARWNGLAAVDVACPIDQGLLTGADEVGIEAILDGGVAESSVYLDRVDLAYRRRYVAAGNRLAFTGAGNAAVTVGGFTDRAILLFDLTTPRRPKLVTGAAIGGSEGSYSISFRPATPSTPYLAVAMSAAAAPASAAAWNSAGLADAANGAEYLVITGEPLLGAAVALADRRAGQGLSTKVVTVAAVMDEFNAGVYDPAGIRAFLATALGRWAVPPRYVVLAGDGSYDYRDFLDEEWGPTDTPVVPPAFVPTPYGLAASDGWYADVDGDHVPEAAIGRLPARTSGELQGLVDKIAAFETATGGAWESSLLFAADNQDAAGDYPADTAAIVASLPAGLTTTIDQVVNQATIGTARTLLKNTVNAGVAHVNWFGHGGYDTLADEKLLFQDAAGAIAPALANGDRLPLFSLFTCAVGDYTDPYFVNLGEALLLEEGGGASAVFTSTGSPVQAKSARLARKLFALRYGGGGGPRLGDVLLAAMEAYAADPEGSDATLEIYGLLGDPGLALR